MNLNHRFFGGKGCKALYYAHIYSTLLVPNFIYRGRRKSLMAKYEKMPKEEREYIQDRVNYYCKLGKVEGFDQIEGVKPLSSHKLSNKRSRGYASLYFFDTYEFTRSLPTHLKWAHLFGDIYVLSPIPVITKSRPISDDNQNSVLMKLDKFRHFIAANDPIPYEKKMDKAVFRGNCDNKQCRLDFLEKFHDSDLCNAGDVCNNPRVPEEWKKPKMTLYEQMQYKFILALEGNDVASNLKWVMSSNSVAVMPKPTCETWFMEARLIPGVHYIEVADDYSDFEEKINYYIAHPEEAKQIVRNANEYWCQFLDTQREEIISHLVLQKFFTQTGQEID